MGDNHNECRRCENLFSIQSDIKDLQKGETMAFFQEVTVIYMGIKIMVLKAWNVVGKTWVLKRPSPVTPLGAFFRTVEGGCL